jgi:hypothetical protein
MHAASMTADTLRGITSVLRSMRVKRGRMKCRTAMARFFRQHVKAATAASPSPGSNKAPSLRMCVRMLKRRVVISHARKGRVWRPVGWAVRARMPGMSDVSLRIRGGIPQRPAEQHQLTAPAGLGP